MIIAVVSVIAYKKKESEKKIVFVPSSVSDARVSNLNLKQAPDIELGILDSKKIKFPSKLKGTGDDNYRSNPQLEWIIDIVPPQGFYFKKDQFLMVFDYEWRKIVESEFYAYFPSTKRWSFAISADSQEYFDSLELAVNLAPVLEEKEITVEVLKSYLAELNKRLAFFDAKMTVTPRESPESAVKRSKSLRQLQNDLNLEIIIVLQADSKFNSKDFWNTLVDLGLKWGDGDLFHWLNDEHEIGGDNFFSVWTSTDPGYFLPEDIAAEQMQPKDIIFGFSVPRSADPVAVYEIMLQAVGYCQTKLGGKIVDENGLPFDKERYKKQIDELIKKMSENGFSQGQGAILRLI
ncbi:MAG: hypothetical protein HYZ44_16455 [Bacteroidetes bacterium]|nr:hypothetical protein [Bacteroidota bacterium]